MARPDIEIWGSDRSAGGPGGRAGLIGRAADLLAGGRLVVLPTESVYGVFAAVGTPGEGALAGLMGEQTARGAAWHTHAPEAVIDALDLADPDHLRLVDRLLPGPVALVRAGEGALAARVVDHPVSAGVLAACAERGLRVVGCAFAGESTCGALGGGRELGGVAGDAGLLDALGELGVGLLIDAGPTAGGRVSTLVRLGEGGSVDVVREGAVPSRGIERAMTRSVLFVCTGNTCRSPMAAAIARAEAQAGRSGARVRIASAGVSAVDGAAMTPEAGRALRAAGVEPGPHRSSALTAAMVGEADEIYGLTASHVAAIGSAFPAARGRVRLLDPQGVDVPDPIGGPQSVYDATCRTLIELVRQRLGRDPTAERRGRHRPAGSGSSAGGSA